MGRGNKLSDWFQRVDWKETTLAFFSIRGVTYMTIYAGFVAGNAAIIAIGGLLALMWRSMTGAWLFDYRTPKPPR